MSMQLTPDLMTGVAVIDEQHATFIAALNKLHNALTLKLSAEEIDGVVNFLEVYTDTHFSAEEHYMRLYEYPQLEEHLEQHRKFVADIEKLKVALAKNSSNVTGLIQITALMMRWLAHHIKNTDKKFAAFLLENGLEFDDRSGV